MRAKPLRDNVPVVVLSSVIAATTCAPASASNTAYFTNSCVETESGDIGGYVVIVSDGKPLPLISLSWSEGALKKPVAAKIKDYNQGFGRISFSVSIDWDEGKKRDIQFDGKLAADRMTGKFTVPWQTDRQSVELVARSRKTAFEPVVTCRSN